MEWLMRLIRTKRILACFIPLVFLIGCGKQEISGQVFVVTQGMGNIKLALVEVGAIPQEDFDKYLKGKQAIKAAQQQQLLPKYMLAKKEVDAAYEKWTSSDVDGGYELWTKTVEKNQSVISEYEAFNSVEYIIDSLPPPMQISKSDADGKFALALPKGRYVIVANGSRKLIDTSETYHWLVQVDNSTPSNFMLSNDNLLETKCKECVKL